jgi:anti-sigma B factor antagonist
MPLSLHSRSVGDVTVVTCAGRIVEGEESTAFQAHLDARMAVNPHILLHLGDVTFVDSAGLGMLVRYLTRAQNSSGTLRICAVSPALDQVLTVTRLKPVLQLFDTESDAIVDAHRNRRDVFGAPEILCVDQSEDVLAYVRELLRRDGRRVMTASNLPDAVILLSAARPKVVVSGRMPQAAAGTRAADEFTRLTSGCALVDLPEGFAGREAADAAGHLLGAIRELFRAPR